MTTTLVSEWMGKMVDKCIKMPELKSKASTLGVKPGKMNKADLIHAIQEAEYCTPCFGTSGGQCGNEDCCFIVDCLKIS